MTKWRETFKGYERARVRGKLKQDDRRLAQQGERMNDHDAVPNRGDRYCSVCRTAIYRLLDKTEDGWDMVYFHESDRVES